VDNQPESCTAVPATLKSVVQAMLHVLARATGLIHPVQSKHVEPGSREQSPRDRAESAARLIWVVQVYAP
jgi:hypothetical protein